MESGLDTQPIAEIPETLSLAVQAPHPYVLDLGKPGELEYGRGVTQTLDVINMLAVHGIPSCVVGAFALVYYGAHRVPMNWEISVPTHLFEQAKKTVLTSIPRGSDEPQYEVWHPVMPQPGSLVHTYPRFTLKGVNFFFILVPTYDCLIDCDNPDEQCERSPSGIPYPKLERFAQALLDRQQDADLADLVDGMDLDEEWGERHLQLDKPPALDYIREKNDLIVRTFPESMRDGAVFALLTETPKPRKVWLRIVGSKERRINDEWPRHRYITRFRKVGSRDPRDIEGREV